VTAETQTFIKETLKRREAIHWQADGRCYIFWHNMCSFHAPSRLPGGLMKHTTVDETLRDRERKREPERKRK